MTNATGHVGERAVAEKSLDVVAADDDERVRALIRAELDRQNALPVARRTLELLAESAVEPVSDSTSYRVVDRHGETRLRPLPVSDSRKRSVKKTGGQPETPPVPLTVGDVVAELRENHPNLFGPTPSLLPTVEDGSPVDRTEVSKARGSRLAGAGSAMLKSLADKSFEGRRFLSSTAREGFANLRTRMDSQKDRVRRLSARPAAQRTEIPAGRLADGQTEPDRPLSNHSGSARIAAFLRSGSARFPQFVSVRKAVPASNASESPERPRRNAIIWAGGTVAVLLVGVLILGREMFPTRDQAVDAPNPAPSEKPSVSPPPTSPSPGDGPARTQTAVPQPDPEMQPPAEEASRDVNDISGVAEVLDTATLRLSGRTVRLFGVEWVRGGQADELAKYLGGRKVVCHPAPGSSAYLCNVDGRDLSEVVLFNGGGRASPEATPDLAAAEDHARSERLGVWKR